MAGDNTLQRQNVANAAVQAATKIVDGLNTLQNLGLQRQKFVSPFVDADFTGPGLQHLTAGMIGTLFDFVVPSLQTTFVDAANGNRNEQILLQVRAG